ncbi:hypothetical protein [Nocardia thraciensis]
MVPFQVWLGLMALLAVLGVLAGAGILVVLAVGENTSSAAADFRYQCDSALGPDPSATETATSTTSAGPRTGSARETMAPSDIPTTNPYAEMTIAPDETEASAWQRSCLTAMRSAPYQLPALDTVNRGPAVDCARGVALQQLGGRTVTDDATLAQYVIAQASEAAVTGRCELSANTTATGGQDAVTPGRTAVAGTCSRSAVTTVSEVVTLPSTVAGQAMCGQRVDPYATSPGDLVFWNYRSHAPTRVGVAVDASHVITGDPATGQVVEQSIPSGSEVRVKRVLKGAT